MNAKNYTERVWLWIKKHAITLIIIVSVNAIYYIKMVSYEYNFMAIIINYSKRECKNYIERVL